MLRIAGLLTGGAGLNVLLVRGALTLDLGIGRRTRPLGPQQVRIDAPREAVFDVIAGPYRRTPRAMRDKLEGHSDQHPRPAPRTPRPVAARPVAGLGRVHP